jgi:hypothetical protein
MSNTNVCSSCILLAIILLLVLVCCLYRFQTSSGCSYQSDCALSQPLRVEKRVGNAPRTIWFGLYEIIADGWWPCYCLLEFGEPHSVMSDRMHCSSPHLYYQLYAAVTKIWFVRNSVRWTWENLLLLACARIFLRTVGAVNPTQKGQNVDFRFSKL